MKDFIKSRANSYSNIAFVCIGCAILAFQLEDYVYFNRTPSPPPPPPPHL